MKLVLMCVFNPNEIMIPNEMMILMIGSAKRSFWAKNF